MKRKYPAFPKREIPNFALIQQRLRNDHIADPRKDVCEKLLAAGLAQKVKLGSRVAITAGSRGFGGFIPLLEGIIAAVKCLGGLPLIIPSMGSHGSATTEGQAELLRSLGVDEKSAPIEATMDTIALGKSETGAVAHLDAIAAKADGIIVMGRVKMHAQNTEGIGSGLLKMTTVGLGKQKGAQEAHNNGLWRSIRAVSKITLAHAKVHCGVAILENAFCQPVVVEVVPGTFEAFEEADKRLLVVSKDHFAKIPFQQLDVLVVDEIGKNISGSGMDLNVVGKWRVSGGEQKPDFRRIVVLSLTRESCGNGLGVGIADFTTERFVKDFDQIATYVNIFTSTERGTMGQRKGSLPLALPNDREAMQVALYSSQAGVNSRICRIKNTANLSQMWVSEGLLEEAKSNPQLIILDQLKPLPFDSSGNLF